MTEVAANFGFDPYDPAFRRDPYTFYKPLYSQPPLVLEMEIPTAVLARYADVVAAPRDPLTFSSDPHVQTAHSLTFGGATTLVPGDPPVPRRLRRLVNRALPPRPNPRA